MNIVIAPKRITNGIVIPWMLSWSGAANRCGGKTFFGLRQWSGIGGELSGSPPKPRRRAGSQHEPVSALFSN